MRLRRLLSVHERQPAAGSGRTDFYTARDPFSRRVIVDKGSRTRSPPASRWSTTPASSAGDRVYPFVSEVTLITDKEQAVPVQIVRNGLRSVVFGLGNGQLELRFMPANADVQEGDMRHLRPRRRSSNRAFPVARSHHRARIAYSFARIQCAVPASRISARSWCSPRAATPAPRPEPAEARRRRDKAPKAKKNAGRPETEDHRARPTFSSPASCCRSGRGSSRCR